MLGKKEGKRPPGRPRRRWVDYIRMDLWGEGVYRVMVGKPEGKIPLGKSKRRWVYNSRMDLWGESSVYVFGGETGWKETAAVT